jgi:hypothetical protein
MQEHPDSHTVRRIVLPSGRSIEVIRFADADTTAPRPLHVCPACDCHLVQPVSWGPASDERWELTLECPNCAWTEEGVYERDAVDELEEQLDDGLADMLCDLQRLTQANMADEVERFTAALEGDLILPEDF